MQYDNVKLNIRDVLRKCKPKSGYVYPYTVKIAETSAPVYFCVVNNNFNINTREFMDYARNVIQLINESDSICRYTNILIDRLPLTGKVNQYHAMSSLSTLLTDKRRSIRFLNFCVHDSSEINTKLPYVAKRKTIRDYSSVLNIDKDNFSKIFPVEMLVDTPVISVSSSNEGYPYFVNLYIYYRSRVIVEGGEKGRLRERIRNRILANELSDNSFVTDIDEDGRVYIAVLIETMATLADFIRTYVALIPFSTVLNILDVDNIADDVAYTLKQFDARILQHKFVLRVKPDVEKFLSKNLKNGSLMGKDENIYDRSPKLM